MKYSKMIKKFLSSFVFLAYFTAQVIGGMVLCQSNDGHTAIEFAQGGKCTELPFENSDGHKHSDDSDHSLIQCEQSHCGDCEDIPLTFVAGNENLQKSITLLKFSAQRTSPAAFAVHNQQSQFLLTSWPRRSPFIAFPIFLHSTVLLI